MTSPVRRWACATALVMASTLALAACSNDPDPTPVSGDTTDATTTDTPDPTQEPSETASPSPSQTPAESPSGSAGGQGGTAVPIYFAGDGPRRTALFREFHRVKGDPLTEAARLVAGGGQADDPDYRSLWPQMEISSVSATDGVLLVQIRSDGFTERPDGMTRRDAKLAVQQMVYTLQGVQQERVPVVIQRADGLPLFGLATDTQFTASSALRTLNLVNITAPAEGDTVTGDSLTVTGVANSFEASGPCRLIAGDREVALKGYQSEGWLEDRLYAFEVLIPLTDVGTGEVVVQCETDDPSGGAEGYGPAIDTKTITLE